MSILFKPIHSANNPFSILSTFSDNFILSNLPHALNACFPILLTLSDIVTLTAPLSSKALAPIYSTLESIE